MDRPPVPSVSGVSSPLSEDLLVRVHAGDRGALDQLLERYLPRLHRWAHRRVPPWARSSADTADFVQDTVLRTLGRLPTFRPQGRGALLGYLRRALTNRMRDQFRHAGRHPAPDALDDHAGDIVDGRESPLELAIRAEDRARYDAALCRLTPADRTAIVASIEFGYTYAQIAVALDKPTSEAARVAVRRALLRLGEEMARDAQG
jgi:RNA polymerase sigma-70 factor (ECF subfamily)